VTLLSKEGQACRSAGKGQLTIPSIFINTSTTRKVYESDIFAGKWIQQQDA
jgi:hypothetical protein